MLPRRCLAGALLALLLALAWAPAVRAQGPEVLSASLESQFPRGLLFRVQARSSVDIVRITVRLQVLGEEVQRYASVEFTPGPDVSVEHLLRTDTADRYIPPGSRLRWWVEVEDAQGGRASTEPADFTLLDPAHQWQELREDDISVFYYGPVEGRAKTVLEAVKQAVGRMAPVLGVEEGGPITVVMFNNYRDALRALPPTSRTIRSTLVTEGTTFPDKGVVLMLADDPEVRGIASHEVTHVLVYRATKDAFVPIPAWLNEGLAEYGNVEPSATYDAYLLRGIVEGRLFPITSLTTPPGKPEDVILFYGEARSVVRYLMEEYGPGKMRSFLQGLNRGLTVDQAMQDAYGFDRRGLDRRWREWLGLPAGGTGATPTPAATPTPIPTLAPFLPSLTPTPAPTPPARATPQATPPPTPLPSPTPGASPGCRGAPGSAGMGLVAVLGLVGALALRRPPSGGRGGSARR